MLVADAPAHTYSRQHCPLCGSDCIQRRYSPRLLAFRQRHREAFEAVAYGTSPEHSRAALERLGREYATLPPGHSCTCICPLEERRDGTPACVECRRLRRSAVQQDVAVEIGRTARAHPPCPPVDWLDEARAEVAGRRTARSAARWLNGEE